MMTQPPASPASDHHPKKKTTSTPGVKQAASHPIPTRRASTKPPTTKPASYVVIKAESRSASPASLPSASKKQLSREPRETVPHHAKPHQKRKGRRNSRRGLWLSIGATVATVVGLIALFSFWGLHSTDTSGAYPITAADPTVMKEVTTVSPSVLAAVGAGQTQTKLTKVSGGSLLTGPTGKPEVFYSGAEYCPYCAAERWPLIVALSRFGSFSHLSQTTSSSTDVYPSTATFSFYHSTYTSQYLDFVSLEVESYQHVSLETPTADEQQIINQYNSGESFPFIDIANQYTILGASYDPQVLSTLDWQQIAAAISNAQSPIAQSILGPANYLTAAICAATNQQPASVCQAAPIPQVQQSLSGSTGALEHRGTCCLFWLPCCAQRRLLGNSVLLVHSVDCPVFPKERADRDNSTDEEALSMKTLQRSVRQWLLLLFAIAGTGTALYLTTVHYAQVPLLCSAQGLVNCELVTSSRYLVVPGTTLPITIPGSVARNFEGT